MSFLAPAIIKKQAQTIQKVQLLGTEYVVVVDALKVGLYQVRVALLLSL